MVSMSMHQSIRVVDLRTKWRSFQECASSTQTQRLRIHFARQDGYGTEMTLVTRTRIVGVVTAQLFSWPPLNGLSPWMVLQLPTPNPRPTFSISEPKPLMRLHRLAGSHAGEKNAFEACLKRAQTGAFLGNVHGVYQYRRCGVGPATKPS